MRATTCAEVSRAARFRSVRRGLPDRGRRSLRRCATATPSEVPPGSRPSPQDPTALGAGDDGRAPGFPGVRGPAGPCRERQAARACQAGKNTSPFLSWEGPRPRGPRRGRSRWWTRPRRAPVSSTGSCWTSRWARRASRREPPARRPCLAARWSCVTTRARTDTPVRSRPQGTHVYRFVLYAMPPPGSSVPSGAGKQRFFPLTAQCARGGDARRDVRAVRRRRVGRRRGRTSAVRSPARCAPRI